MLARPLRWRVLSIQETPLILATGAGFAASPNLASLVFDHAMANGAYANLNSSEQIHLVDWSGAAIVTPSRPDPDTDGFSVCTWTTCSAPTSS